MRIITPKRQTININPNIPLYNIGRALKYIEALKIFLFMPKYYKKGIVLTSWSK